MQKSEEIQYQTTEELRKIIRSLKGQKFILDCGHKITFGYHLGNNIIIFNGKNPEVICSQCGY